MREKILIKDTSYVLAIKMELMSWLRIFKVFNRWFLLFLENQWILASACIVPYIIRMNIWFVWNTVKYKSKEKQIHPAKCMTSSWLYSVKFTHFQIGKYVFKYASRAQHLIKQYHICIDVCVCMCLLYKYVQSIYVRSLSMLNLTWSIWEPQSLYVWYHFR